MRALYRLIVPNSALHLELTFLDRLAWLQTLSDEQFVNFVNQPHSPSFFVKCRR